MVERRVTGPHYWPTCARPNRRARLEANEDTKIAVKVIDHRRNELMVVKTIGEALVP